MKMLIATIMAFGAAAQAQTAPNTWSATDYLPAQAGSCGIVQTGNPDVLLVSIPGNYFYKYTISTRGFDQLTMPQGYGSSDRMTYFAPGNQVFMATSWIMARYININKFSLHGMYRNRLIRAYLGASNPKRNASGFTGFAQSDNLQMRDFHANLKPLHVVNLSLNVVSGERLAWQQRKAQAFSVSPLYSYLAATIISFPFKAIFVTYTISIGIRFIKSSG
jgi:hypothetical protein